MLLLEYNKFSEQEVLRVNDELQLRLAETTATDIGLMNATEQTSATLWDSCVILSKYLEANPSLIEGKSCIELGAGKGILGLYCAALGARKVVLTDVELAVPTLRKTIDLNPSLAGILSAQELDWTSPHGLKGFDVVLGADIVWVLDLVQPLVQTIQSISTSETLIILADQQRSKICQDEFFKQLRQCGFVVDIVQWTHPRYQKDSVKIYQIRK